MAILCVASPASGASVPNWGPVKRLSPSPGIDAFVGSIAINDRGDAVVAARIERRIVAPVSPLRVP